MKTHRVPQVVRPGSGRLLSIDDVAGLLNVSRKTVYRLTSSGELPASRVGERLRFRPREIDEYLDRRRVRVGAAP